MYNELRYEEQRILYILKTLTWPYHGFVFVTPSAYIHSSKSVCRPQVLLPSFLSCLLCWLSLRMRNGAGEIRRSLWWFTAPDCNEQGVILKATSWFFKDKPTFKWELGWQAIDRICRLGLINFQFGCMTSAAPAVCGNIRANHFRISDRSDGA